MTALPDRQLINVRTDALALAVAATAPLDGLLPQLQVTDLADYFEAWILRAPDKTHALADVKAEMEAELDAAARKSGGTT